MVDAVLESQAGSSSQAEAQPRSDDAAALLGSSHPPAPPGGDSPRRPLMVGAEEAEQCGGSGFGGQLFWVWIFPSLCFGWWCDWWQSPPRGGNRTPCPGLCEDLAGGLPGLPGQGSQALSDQDEDETSLQLLSADRGVRGVQGLAPATEGYAGAGPKNACRPVCETFDGQAHSSAAR